MFRDPDVRLIVAAIGGDHSCHLLPLLDFDLIAAHPKLFMGYSDITVLNVAIWQRTGLVTFNGPTLLTDFAEHPKMFEYTQAAFLKAVVRSRAPSAASPSPHPGGPRSFSTGGSGWTSRVRGGKNPRRAGPGSRAARARAFSWEVASSRFKHLRGTSYWPDWDDAILFFETSEETPSPAKVDGILMDYENMGVFDRLRGMLVGRPMRYSAADRERLRAIILERTAAHDFPIVTDMDFGHTAPQFTLPIRLPRKDRRREPALRDSRGCRGGLSLSSRRINMDRAPCEVLSTSPVMARVRVLLVAERFMPGGARILQLESGVAQGRESA